MIKPINTRTDLPPSVELIELRHLRYFMAAVDHGSFRKAAAAMNIRESTVSRRISNLELILNAALFYREKSGSRLTPAGSRFYSSATNIMRYLSDATSHLIEKFPENSSVGKLSFIHSITSEAQPIRTHFHRDFFLPRTNAKIYFVR